MKKNKFLNIDCMDPEQGLPSYPDNFFDLAIVDPPYGIAEKIYNGGGGHTKSNCKFHHFFENGTKWDNEVPSPEYFAQLQRTSKNVIIWGGNYFNLPPTRGIICWDKIKVVSNFSQWEMAWTNIEMPAKIYRFCSNGGFILSNKNKERIHPTQKPVELYEALLSDFAEKGFKILDTHVGSASSLIACESMGLEYVGFEIDPDYYEAAKNRMSKGIQQVIF